MRCRWCKQPLPKGQAAKALIGLAPMAHPDARDCGSTVEPDAEEDRDWTPQPPPDIDTCGGCRGAGEVMVGQEWGTGAPITETCTWCRGTGRPFPWNVLTTSDPR
jgi:hypothetical protein